MVVSKKYELIVATMFRLFSNVRGNDAAAKLGVTCDLSKFRLFSVCYYFAQ